MALPRRIALKSSIARPIVAQKTSFALPVLWLSILLAGTMLTGCQPKPQSQEPKQQPAQGGAQPVEKFGVTVVSGPMDSILLKDYAPGSSLVVPETKVAKAKFPAIDVHAHVYAETKEEVADWVKTMDEVGVERTIILTDATGAEFDRLVDLYLKPHPDRFQLYCGLDTNDSGASDYRNELFASWCAAMRKEPAASANSRTRVGAITEVQRILCHVIRGFTPTIPGSICSGRSVPS
jgi:hypothetical protein